MPEARAVYPTWYWVWSRRARWVYKYPLRGALIIGLALFYFQIYAAGVLLVLVGATTILLVGLDDRSYDAGSVPNKLVRDMTVRFLKENNVGYIGHRLALQTSTRGYVHVPGPDDYIELLYATGAKQQGKPNISDWWLTSDGLAAGRLALMTELNGPRADMLNMVHNFLISTYYR